MRLRSAQKTTTHAPAYLDDTLGRNKKRDMESELISQLEKVLPVRMQIPDEIKMLYRWIEENNLFVDNADGTRFGFLYPEKDLRISWTDTEREGGTTIEFFAGGVENLKYWFGGDHNPEVQDGLCVFAQSGAEGSQCAFWLTDNREVKIVHMGSGSGSCLTCVLADSAVDFLSLLAIGYDEICWEENFPCKPNENNDGFFVKPNTAFQHWVTATFGVKIPTTALEIVKHPATMNDESSDDPFSTGTGNLSCETKSAAQAFSPVDFVHILGFVPTYRIG